MSFDQKKNMIEKDDMNIQSHLNTSLELDGISVSEDLINRTLEAIRKQPLKAFVQDEAVKRSEPRITPWTRYIRNFAAVAAAGLILVVGFNSLSEKSSKEDSSQNSSDGISYDIATSEEAAKDNAETTAAEPAENGVSQFIMKADRNSDAKTEAEDQFAMDAAVENENDTMELADDTGITIAGEAKGKSAALNDIYTLTFKDICPIPVEAAESINITEGVTNNSIFLSNRSDIEGFYNMMENFAFTEGAQSSGVNSYLIRISSAGASFTLTVEDKNIITSYTYGDDKVDGRYNTEDHPLLLLELERLYLKYNQ